MKWRRRQYLIDQKFQWRFVRRLITPFILGLIIITIIDYYFIWSVFTSPIPGSYENMGPIVLKISGYLLFYALCIIIPIIAIMGVIISHRIAGPLFHIERVLSNIGDGDLSSRVVLRQKDELKNLAMSVNEMATALSNKIYAIEESMKVLEEKLFSLESESEKELPNINKIREEIKIIHSSLILFKGTLNKFRR